MAALLLVIACAWFSPLLRTNLFLSAQPASKSDIKWSYVLIVVLGIIPVTAVVCVVVWSCDGKHCTEEIQEQPSLVV
jgi:hypothetical protein